MKTIEKTIFVTDDGMEFIDEESAKRHEMNLKNIQHFLVSYTPDRTGTGRYTKRMAIAVHTAQKCLDILSRLKPGRISGTNVPCEG